MSKGTLRLAVIGGLLVVSFAISAGISWLTRKPAPAEHAKAAAGSAESAAPEAVAAAPSERLRPQEVQLEDLIKEMRDKLASLRRREEQVERRERQLDMAHEALRKDAQDLEALRLSLVSPLARLKEAKTELEQTRVLVTRGEAENIKKTALVYEKMDPASSSRILTEMASSSQEADAARILHYMSERAAAKCLSEIADKKLAARLSDHLKRIKEES